MKRRSPKSVRRLLKDKPTLKSLEREVCARQALLAEVRRVLPDDVAAHCVAAQARDGELVVHADAAVWATRLRYFEPRLLDSLRPSQTSLNAVRVRLLLPQHPRAVRRSPARRSDTAASIIHDSARETKHAGLRDALLRLSRALKPPA